MRQILLIVLVAAAVTAAAAVLMEWTRQFDERSGDQAQEGGETAWDRTRSTLNKVVDSAEKAGRSATWEGIKALPSTREKVDKLDKKIAGTTGPKDASNAPRNSSGSRPTIVLPGIIGGARFGMSPDKIKDRFDISWGRRSRGRLILVHKPKESRSARFIFSRHEGLSAIELRFLAPDRRQINEIYRRVRSDYHRRYGDLPGSGRTYWTNGRIRVRIEEERDHVALIFVPHR